MTEKIEWYKEVFELDPGSKLFFPLARLLVEDHRLDEAIDVLQRGLQRHDEFLEARLLLIELLHTSGKVTACEQQVMKLAQKLSTYASFWQAWATCLDNSGTGKDTAAALRFLALFFSRGDVSLLDIFTRGLSSYGTMTSTSVHEDIPQCVDSTPCDADKSQMHLSGNVAHPVHAPQSFSEPPVSHDNPAEETLATDEHLTEVGQDQHQAQDTAMPNCLVPDVQEITPEVSVTNSMALPADALRDAYAQESRTSSVLVGDSDDLSTDDETLQSVDVPSEKDEDSAHVTESLLFPTSKQPFIASAMTDIDERKEHFSVRTRSMAEVLAEQGDVQGALDIYHELAAAAIDMEESADLNKRIATLNTRLGNVQPFTAPAETIRGKDTLISMLEALAERVEARAQHS